MNDEAGELDQAERNESRAQAIAWPALVFAILQSVCTAFIAASGMRFALGFAAFITAVVTSNTAQELHRDAIRLPMLLFAVASAVINLAVILHARWLRGRPAAQWRVGPLSARKGRMERWQVALNIGTLLLVFLELLGHRKLHGFYLAWLFLFR